jgi:hypothetical protein
VKALICGGRNYYARQTVFDALNALCPDVVIEGGANGADAFAAAWAKGTKTPLWTFPANWQVHGPAAGPMRNGSMLQHGQPDVVLAFEGGRGTESMTRKAEALGVLVVRPDSDDQWLAKVRAMSAPAESELERIRRQA